MVHRRRRLSDPYVRPDVRVFLDYLARVPGPRMHELDAPAARAQYLAMKDVADLGVGDLAVMRDVAIPVAGGTIGARVFDTCEDRVAGPVVVFYHGGGFVIGDVATHAGFCAEMARTLDLPVVSVAYRLAPEHPWPTAPDDAEAAARWVADAPPELGLKVASLVLAGDSAGGKLTITTAMALRDAPAAVPVIAQFPIYPAADFSQAYPSFEQFADGYLLTREGLQYFADAYRSDPSQVRGSPLLGDCHDLPRALVLTASLDPIRDQGRAYAAKLAQAGVAVNFREARGNIHGFVTLRRAIPSSVGDVAGALAVLKTIVTEAEADRVMAQAAGTR
ncbi:lipase [Sphingomonas sp. Leaf407]|uniref:alpha/beta hydrolase n=1 Tax=unclassified Sphingomonas TaxID=196159 RepID=UPI0006F2262B|nr:lipase [Sphingomonas sp. Leaf42]KQT30082.1 lipase [Sphingomonas sp. Leaf407]